MTMGIEKMKSEVKIFGWVIGGLVLVSFLTWTGFFVWDHFDEARIAREVAHALAVREAEEGVVGETPQETFSLFLDALRENDFDHAVYYFIPEMREAWRMHITAIEKAGFLDDMIADLENQEDTFPFLDEHFRGQDGQWHLVSL